MQRSLLPAVHRCNSFLFSAACSRPRCVPFVCDGVRVGMVRPDFLEELRLHPSVFRCTDAAVQLVSDSPEERTRHVGELVLRWRAAKRFDCLAGWRGETYPVLARHGDPPMFTLERAAVGIFGFQSFGVHVNGYVVAGAEAEPRLWIARRAPTKSMWPNYLDNFVGGGLPVGISVRDNLLKEAGEEAGVPRELAAQAVPVGAISYFNELPRGLYPESLYVYDLRLPEDFVPVPEDGEVAGFSLWGVEEVIRRILNDEFQPECALVTVDFLIRRGIITPENEPNYLELVAGMRARFFD